MQQILIANDYGPKPIEQFLTNVVGIDGPSFYLSDASGLSPQTKATPSSIIKVLNTIY